MNNKTMLREGEQLLFSCGEYSDYGVIGLFTVTIDFRPAVVFKQFSEKFPEKIKRYESERKFVTHLLEVGLIKPVVSREWYLGDYGYEGMTLYDDIS